MFARDTEVSGLIKRNLKFKGEAMTRKDLAVKVSNKARMNLEDADNAIVAMLDCLKQGLATDGKVTINEFGVFKALDKAERVGRNPKTGERHVVSARRSVSFKASQSFKNLLNEG